MSEHERKHEPGDAEQVRITPTLVVLGVVALLLGLAGGVVFSLMSVIH